MQVYAVGRIGGQKTLNSNESVLMLNKRWAKLYNISLSVKYALQLFLYLLYLFLNRIRGKNENNFLDSKIYSKRTLHIFMKNKQ